MNCLPMVTCPACEKEQQWDDYYDIGVGHSRECRFCEAEIEVTSVDVCTYVGLKVAPKPLTVGDEHGR